MLLWGWSIFVLQSSDEKLAAVCYVDIHIAVHGMLGKKINTEFFACLGEPE
jgi:hypothetical protein